jgi:hypothetical protein
MFEGVYTVFYFLFMSCKAANEMMLGPIKLR